MSHTLETLNAFLKAAGIEHFTAREVCPVGKKANGDGPALHLAPRQIWDNIIPTLKVLDELREHFGRPVAILSGYRDPAYNRAVGGAKNSVHVAFNASDITVAGVKPIEVAKYLDMRKDASRMGIGLYAKSNFVHVDTRGRIGRSAPARWDYQTSVRWWE